MTRRGLLAFGFAESFSSENPWVRRVTGLPVPSSRGRRAVAVLVSLVLLVAVLPVVWGLGFSGVVEGMTGFAAAVTYTLAVSVAFTFPALGAAARERLERDPLLPGVLLTPLSDREALAAVHGRVLAWSGLALVVPATMAAFLILMVHTDFVVLASEMRFTLIHHFLGPMGFWELLSVNESVANGVATVAGVVMVGNYWAGCYLRGAVLAGFCQLDPSSRWKGGLVTALLVVLNMVSLVGRLLAPYGLSSLTGQPLGVGGVFLILGALEVVFLVVRMRSARWFWGRTLAVGLDETRAFLEGDGRVGRFVS